MFTGTPKHADFVATVTVWRLVQGQRYAFTATARWTEYKPESHDFMWQKMLEKVAEAKALRRAFPDPLSGLYAREELDQADAPVPPVRDDAPSTVTHRAWITAVDEETKPGRSGKGQFTKATITLSTGEQVTTIVDAIRESAHSCKADGVDVVITTKPTRWGQEMVTLERPDVAASDVEMPL